MASTGQTRRFTPAPRVLALMMGIPLVLVGLIGLGWHFLIGPSWVLGEHVWLDIFHLVMGFLALGAGRSKASATGYGGLAFVVFLVATALSGIGVAMVNEHIVFPGAHWLSTNAIGFTEINYIFYALMAFWGLLLALTAMDVDPSGSGDSHASLRTLPDREHAIEDERRELAAHSHED